MAIDVCDVLREMEAHLMQVLSGAEATVARTRAALLAVQEAKLREGCEGTTEPLDEQPTLPGIDADLGMGEPSDVPKAYEPPKE